MKKLEIRVYFASTKVANTVKHVAKVYTLRSKERSALSLTKPVY
jgi:hypothetical protein